MSGLTIEISDLLQDGGSATFFSPDVTPELLRAFCRKNETLRIERQATGEIVVMAPGDSFGGSYNASIVLQLGLWHRMNGEPGVFFDSSSGFTLPSGAMRAPDASWMSQARIDALPDDEMEGFIPACPEFVVELMSPSDRLAVAQAKMEEWLENGALLGWLIDRKARRIYVYRPSVTVDVLENPARVSADPEVSGFVLETESIFRTIVKSPGARAQ